jgi:hypothetical protein
MSAESVTVVRSVYENFGKGDIPAVLGVMAPDIEWTEGSQSFLPHHGVHRGPAAVAEKVFGMVTATSTSSLSFPSGFTTPATSWWSRVARWERASEERFSTRPPVGCGPCTTGASPPITTITTPTHGGWH